MLINDFEKLGISGKEAQVYLACLELGETNIQRIAAKSGIKRTTVYDVIEGLKKQGLLSAVIKNKKILYSAEDPRKLEERLEEQKAVLRNMLPELLSFANFIDKKPKIRFFEGLEGIKEVYKDTLNYPDRELVGWVSQEAITKFDPDFLDNYYLPQRAKKKIWVRVFVPDLPELRPYVGLNEKQLRRTKLMSASRFPLEIEINIYGDFKVAMMAFGERIGLIIESKKIHNTLKSIFEMSWEQAS